MKILSIGTRKNLEDQIKRKEFFNFYIIFGKEFFNVETCVKKLTEVVLEKQVRGFNLSVFDGQEIDFDGLQNAVSVVPVLSNYRVVLIKNICFLKLSSVELKKFKNISKNVSETTILIVTATTEDYDYGEIKKFKNLLKSFESFATIIDCSFKFNSELFNFFSKKAVELGSSINKSNFNCLVERVSSNCRVVYSEITKLSLFASGREITKADILNLTKASLSSTAFELVGEIVNCNLEKVLVIFKNLIELNVNLFLICGAINSSFVDLYRVCVCLKNGLSFDEIVNIFNYKGKEFKIKKSVSLAKKISLVKIKHILHCLAELDFKLKTTAIDKQILVEMSLVEMTTVY